MADMILGRLASIFVEEAQLLGGVRGDVQFIKDEMESMNGFLLHVAQATGDADEEDHQVRAWMKQVAEVAYASQNSIDLYVQSLGARGQQGFLGYLRRLPRLVWTLPKRHRIATQIRELKSRSCEVGERRMRYDVKAPESNNRDRANVKKAGWQAAGDDDAEEQEDARRRALADANPSDECLGGEEYKGTLIKLLTGEGDDHGGQHNLSVIAVVGMSDSGKTCPAMSAFQDSFIERSFDCRVWITVGSESTRAVLFFRQVLAALASPADQLDLDVKEEQLVKKIQLHLKGKRLLLVVDDVWDRYLWDRIKYAFLDGSCSPGSAILVTTRLDEVANSFSPCESLHMGPTAFFLEKAIRLINSNNQNMEVRPLLSTILTKCGSYNWPCRLFLRALYVDPNKTKEELQSLCNNLDNSSTSLSSLLNNVRQILIFCNLSSNCKNCFLYMSIFPEDTTFTRTRLVRRWAVDGMITKRGRLSALDEADHCFDLLVAHGLFMPRHIDVTGKVKSCKMHDLILELVTEIAREDNFVNTNLQPDLAHRLSARNGLQPERVKKLHATHSKSCWNICNHFNRSYRTTIDQSNATEVFLESLPSSTHLELLVVLDLENYKELKDHHLKNICNHVFQLKYLSLRNTDITELPKQLDKLRYLETLDIRQTKVRAFAKNSVFLPKLKHLLAGHRTGCERQDSNHIDCTSQTSNQSEEMFLTVNMPTHIGAMTELQVLSHVAVSGTGDELVDVGNLLRLVKLGVTLHGCKGPVFRHLYRAIENLSKCLRSLSIRITADKENADMNMEGALIIPLKYLQKLEISGLGNGLPPWAEKLGLLTKITLHKTLLTAGDIEILGKLKSLCYLRLRHESCTESKLTFSKGEFQSLKFLVIECSVITSINFDKETSPKLKKIVWSSTGTRSLSGIENLPRLQELKLTGNFNLETVKQAIAANKNNPILVTTDDN